MMSFCTFCHDTNVAWTPYSSPCADWIRLQGYAQQWRHNERDGFSNRRRLDCLLNRLFRRRSKKISKLRVTGLWEGNSPVTGEFSTERSIYAENVSIWWRHHGFVNALFYMLNALFYMQMPLIIWTGMKYYILASDFSNLSDQGSASSNDVSK